jgi:parallel beta-helix repeat protein
MSLAALIPLCFATGVAAGERGNSGLPQGPGNPLADLQQQINELAGRVGTIEGAQPLTLTVDCATQSIGATLANAPDVPLTIVVKGACAENVTIARDDVTLTADPSGGALFGPDATRNTLSVNGSRVTVEMLAISGGRVGVAAWGSPRLVVQSCTVHQTARAGISIHHGADATISDCIVQDNERHGIFVEGGAATILNNSITGNGDNGVMIVNNGNARVGITSQNAPAANTITGNGGNGVHVGGGGSAFLAANLIDGNGTTGTSLYGRYGLAVVHGSSANLAGGNTISNNPGGGVFVRNGTVFIGDGSFGLPTQNLIANNGDSGIQVIAGTADIRNATITGNAGQNAGIYVRQGQIEIRNSTISQNQPYGVFGNVGSAVEIQGTTITQNSGHGLFLAMMSAGRLTGGAVTANAGDGVQAVTGSGVQFRTPATDVSGNGNFGLQCLGTQTGYTGNVSGVSGNAGGQVLCPPL